MRTCRHFALTLAAGWFAAGIVNAAEPPKGTKLTEKEISDGWINLFDGETTFGWKVEGEAVVKDGKLLIGGEKVTKLSTTSLLPNGYLKRSFEVIAGKGVNGGKMFIPGGKVLVDFGVYSKQIATAPTFIEHADPTVAPSPPASLIIEVPAGQQIAFSELAWSPDETKPIFNNKNLAGWKVFDANPAQAKCKFEVTPAGELHVTGGPGDIQTDAKYADFVLQLQAKTNGPTVNSGLFFRCIPGEYQNGYEIQIQNGIKDNDRTKPTDGGTGAIYRRHPARKVVSNDGEWFTMTVIANGPHIATWVNGYQTADWTDDRKPDDNPRKGLRTAAGHLSIQGHGPPMVADVLFKSIKIAELKAAAK